MQAIDPQCDPEYGELASLYWLGFLLTECSDLATSTAVESLGSSRKLAVERLLAESRPAVPLHGSRARPYVADMGAELDWPQLKEVLLDLDLFSRRSLLLTVFEGYSLADAARLLGQDVHTVAAARAAALVRLTGSLACSELAASIE